MDTRKRLKYPEATRQRDHFADVAAKLAACSKEIQDGANKARREMRSLSAESPDCAGDYYERYVLAKDRVLGEMLRLVEGFERFDGQLQARIQSAGTQRDLWASRIAVMEEY
jgi:hypothetical protein